ncbi:peroxidasin homolog isoform X2 [Acyrthosiphon pisum]|uniref:Ig-like domain-containing protein n=1 Tax=Acyrthosiphon pisum TaxID=7029 RepID=A0A8R2JRX0_ACYPI|nr:peroxidasin homolog isoform X2 [Acyrthosiphon pisum]
MTFPMHQDAAAAAVFRRTMVLLLLLLMFSLSSFPSVTAECPDKCWCQEVRVYCSYQGLDRIPNSISPATKLLDLDYNEIRDIESLAHLTELETLYLSNNNISEVKNGAFSNLSQLQALFLHRNKIENIETGAFNNLVSLKVLQLDYNNIHKLDLEMFKGLTKLNRLFLDHNMIRNIPPGTLDSLTSLSILQLDHNPLTCDCNILLFVKVLKKNYPQRDVLGNYDPSCHFPVEMSEKSLKEITENDFNCTSPQIIVVPEKKTVSVGEQLQLSCKVVGDPEPYIMWAKDDINLELGKRVQVFQNNTLIISKVERTDGGQYKCVASNYLGRKSFEAMVNVYGLTEND